MLSTREGEAGIDAKAERLERAIEELRQRFGEWVVYRLREARPRLGERSVSTGSIGLDRATGTGGVARGRVSELSGPPTSGKSTLAAHIIANAQCRGGFAAFLDTDGSADFERLRVWGGYGGSLTRGAPEHAGGNGHRLPAGGFRRAGCAAHIPHQRASAGSSWRQQSLSVGAQTPHGRALGLTHCRGAAEVVKHKLASPDRTAEIDLLRDRGIHRGAEAFELGLVSGAVSAGPLGFSYGDIWLGRGRESSIRTLDNDPVLREALRTALLTERS